MKINIGSKNPAKIQAVQEIFNLYFNNLIIKSVDVDSGVESQPIKLEDITRGAINRAEKCFNNCDYSVGIESGIFPVQKTLTDYINISCSAIYDGNRIVGIGLSPGFEFPRSAIEKILKGKTEANEIFDEKFNTKDIGKKGGVISILSKGKYQRKELHKAGTLMALIPIINKEFYEE